MAMLMVILFLTIKQRSVMYLISCNSIQLTPYFLAMVDVVRLD